MRSLQIAIAVAMVCAIAGVCAARPSAEDEAPGFKAAKGRVTFRTYCASCHGREATGDGNLARYLNVPPADLTGIAARRGGSFPREEIAEIIDGRRQVKGHGDRDMPVWGDVFQSPLSDTEPAQEEDPEERVRRKIEELVLFLESIQAVD
jgi:mono/diheme cytochrome c family protein